MGWVLSWSEAIQAIGQRVDFVTKARFGLRTNSSVWVVVLDSTIAVLGCREIWVKILAQHGRGVQGELSDAGAVEPGVDADGDCTGGRLRFIVEFDESSGSIAGEEVSESATDAALRFVLRRQHESAWGAVLDRLATSGHLEVVAYPYHVPRATDLGEQTLEHTPVAYKHRPKHRVVFPEQPPLVRVGLRETSPDGEVREGASDGAPWELLVLRVNGSEARR